jgi:hypothetical protein
MIDTVTILVPSKYSKSLRLSELHRPSSFIPHHIGEVMLRGYLKNLSVRQTISGLLIQGSIAKYIFDQNLFIPSLSQIESALKEISSQLNFNLNKTIVRRIDIGYNFSMKRKVKRYLAEFGDLCLLKKMVVHDLESVYYSTEKKNKQLIFYHKIREMKRNQVKIPAGYQDQDDYILRYELKLRNLKRELDTEHITADMLYTNDFLSSVIKKWRDMYFNIHKTNRVRFRKYVFSKQSTLKTALAAFGLQKLGYDYVLNQVEMEKDKYSRTRVSRLKRMLKDLSTNTAATVSYPLITELDEKVEDVYHNYLSNRVEVE